MTFQDGPDYTIRPVGIFHADAIYTYDVPRQGILAGDNTGIVTLERNCGFEQALECLEGFSHIWLLFLFDRNHGWRPKIQPPRHVDHKVGVFASRSPYRPNGIGMSAVRLLGIHGLAIHVGGHDLLDGTPIVDIKPYLPYADSFPEASVGWTGEGDTREFTVVFSAEAEARLAWLEARDVTCLRRFALDHLALEPANPRRHRLVDQTGGGIALAYRTWRMPFSIDGAVVTVHSVFSGYTAEQLEEAVDKYGDKPLHREFVYHFLGEIGNE